MFLSWIISLFNSITIGSLAEVHNCESFLIGVDVKVIKVFEKVEESAKTSFGLVSDISSTEDSIVTGGDKSKLLFSKML